MATPTLPNDYSSYPVFAADQVLTSDDLNEMFNYLDEQERLSRIYLVGMGIVCGFELTADLTKPILSVSGGTGITSFGYLIFRDAIDLQFYQAYTIPPSVQSDDLYTPFTPANGNLLQLQSADFVNNLSTSDQAKWKSLSVGGTALLNDKLVVIYLELSQDTMKSCLTGNCDGPGANMDLAVRYLLVDRNDLYPLDKLLVPGAITSPNQLPDLFLPRFNVPAGALPDFTSIYTAYSAIFDTTAPGNIISQLSGALQNLYSFLKPILTDYPNSPFLQVQTTLTNLLAGVTKNKPFAIQYFYDFLDDLILAYREAQTRCYTWIGKCKPDTGKFPLHLSLGFATTETAGQVMDFRDYFIPSILIAGNPDAVEELRQLFDRINQMINTFIIPAYSLVNSGIGILAAAKQPSVAIRITPSSSGRAPLSQRAIPYYYPIKTAKPIQQDWSYALTKAGKSNENLSYNAGLYNVLPGGAPFVNPLQYDILPYDFFRIEGHIGQNYNTVLAALNAQINTYRLPFQVMALKLGADASDITPNTASFGDLTSAFDVLRSALLCTLATQVCFYGGQRYRSTLHFPFLQSMGILNKDLKLSDVVLSLAKEAPAAAAGPIAAPAPPPPAAPPTAGSSAATVTSAAVISFSNLAQTGLQDADVLKYTMLLPANLRNIFQINIYTKGQFLSSQPCFKTMSQTDQLFSTVGLTYIARVSARSAITAGTPNDLDSLSDYLVALLDLIDAVVAGVFYVQLGNLNISDFTTKYNNMTAYAGAIIQLLKVQQTASNVPAGMIDALSRLQNSCNLGELTALSQDYRTRFTALQQSLLFGNFIKTNPAIDHRGGVPRAGTLLLVYYEKPPAASTASANSGASVSGQLVANLSDTAALKSIVATGAVKASTPAVAARTATASNSNVSQLVNLIQDKQFGFSHAQQTQILQVLNQKASAAAPTTDASFSLTNNSVVADFFIPYLYNPQAGSVTYIFPSNPTVDPNPAPTAQFVVKPARFVFNDSNTYHILVSPVLTQANILRQTTDPTKLSNPDNLALTATTADVSFVPQASNITKTLQSTLSYQGIIQTITIIAPLARFTLALTKDPPPPSQPGNDLPAPALSRILHLTAADTSADSYAWTINGNNADIPATASPSVDYEELKKVLNAPAELVISLTITYTINEVKAADTKTSTMKAAELENKLNAGPIQPVFNS